MLKWGIVGLGKIAHSFMRDILLVDGNVVSAVASRTLDKAEKFKSDFNLNCQVYSDYTSLFKDSDVDIVYIATPHNSHRNLSIEAMSNGRHVLCEKPLAINYQEVLSMVNASKENQKFLMEALWTRFNPTIMHIIKLVESGAIGEIKSIDVDFSHNITGSPKSRLFNMDLAGGSLLDMGIYPVFLTYLLLGKPQVIKALGRFHITGADVQTSAIFEYKNAMATVSSSFISYSDMIAKIYGTDGKIFINKRWHETEGFVIEKDGYREEIEIPKIGKGYAHEIMECQRQIENGKLESELWSHNDSLNLIEILDLIRKEIGLKYPQEMKG